MILKISSVHPALYLSKKRRIRKMAKATNGQKNQRIRAVFELLLSDTPRPDIMQYSANNWGLTTRQTDKYIAWANELIEAESAAMQTEAFAQALGKLKIMRHSALKAVDLRLAFDMTKEINKLLNLYPPKESKVTNLDVDLSQLTDDQLQRIAAGEDPASVMVDK